MNLWKCGEKVNVPEDSLAGGLVYSLQRQFGHGYLVSPTEAARYIDFAHQQLVSQLDIKLPTGDEQVATVIYRSSASEMRSTYNGRKSPTQLMPAPQNWGLSNPISALRAAYEAPDLQIVGTSTLYGSPHTLVRFIHDSQPITLELNDYNG
jgi:hypothetical protein